MTIDDTNWKEELLANTSSKFEEKLLTEGAKSVNQGYILGNLYNKWARLKGVKIERPISNEGQLQSSYLDFEKRNNTNKK